MSDILKEYNNVVTDLTPFDYFDIQGCLETLPWSILQCYRHIRPQEGYRFNRTEVVQLALYTCPPFRDAPDGYIVDCSDHECGDKGPREYPCHSLRVLIQELSMSFMAYEASCKYSFGWPTFQRKLAMCINFLEGDFLAIWERQKGRRVTPKHPNLKRHRKMRENIHNTTNDLRSFTEHDYEAARGPTNTPSHPVAKVLKWQLLQDMDKAFKRHVSWPQEATYRALASILTQMKIFNTRRSRWKPPAVKMFLKRDWSEHVAWTKPLYVLEAQVVERPDITIWNMKVK